MSSLYITNIVMSVSQEENSEGICVGILAKAIITVREFIFFLFLFVQMIYNEHGLFNNKKKKA